MLVPVKEAAESYRHSQSQELFTRAPFWGVRGLHPAILDPWAMAQLARLDHRRIEKRESVASVQTLPDHGPVVEYVYLCRLSEPGCKSVPANTVTCDAGHDNRPANGCRLGFRIRKGRAEDAIPQKSTVLHPQSISKHSSGWYDRAGQINVTDGRPATHAAANNLTVSTIPPSTEQHHTIAELPNNHSMSI